VPDPRVYMRPAEFARLPAAVRHAVWDLHAVRRIDAVPWSTQPGGTLVYNRAQVLALLRGTAAARG